MDDPSARLSTLKKPGREDACAHAVFLVTSRQRTAQLSVELLTIMTCRLSSDQNSLKKWDRAVSILAIILGKCVPGKCIPGTCTKRK
jgi:hypothetical protein